MIKPRLWHTIRQPVCDWVRRQSMVQKLAAEYGYTVRILNDGQHWEFKRVDLLVEWWPSTGAVIVGKKSDRRVLHTFNGLRAALHEWSVSQFVRAHQDLLRTC